MHTPNSYVPSSGVRALPQAPLFKPKLLEQVLTSEGAGRQAEDEEENDLMRQILQSLAIMIVVSRLPPAGKPPTVKRLDGSTITPAEIDATVTRLMREANVTGVGIAIFNDGRVAFSKTYGFRDKQNGLPLTEDSVMSAASFTKVAFAYMVMQLVEERLLDLDKPVYQYLPKPLPEYPGYKDLADDPRHKQITARMLLSHTSGFPNWRRFNINQKLNINFEPGSRYAYSGEGVQLLQLVVETVTKNPVQELMRSRIFEPFGMTRSSMVWESRFEDNLAFPYNEDGRSLGPPEQRAPAAAAGSMLTTLRDFTVFMKAVISSRSLRKETRDLMLSPQIQILSKHQFPTLHQKPRRRTTRSASATDLGGASTGLRMVRHFSKKATARVGTTIRSASTTRRRASSL